MKIGARTFKRMREEKLSVLDILKSFPSVKIPFEVLLDNLLKLQPRYYSIASSNLSSKSSICIGFGIVDYPFMNRLFNGLCSGYIDSIMSLPDAQLAIFPKSRGLVTLSQRKKVIMICTGTGVTPFMSLIEDNRIRYEKERSNGNVLEKQSKMWLFYGCRFRGNEGDMLYRKELENAKEIGVLQELTVAYSRDEKEYIQDKMNMNRGMLVEWMKDGASIYVCGGLGMSKDVHSTLMSIFDDGEQNVSEYMQQLVNENRYVREIWG